MRDNTLYDRTYTEVQSAFFREQREKNGRTLDDVAYFVNVKKTTYYGYERGRRDMPMSVFIDLCRLYNLNYAKVFEQLNKETEKRCGKTALDDR